MKTDNDNKVGIKRTHVRLYADVRKVLLRYLDFGLDRQRIMPIYDHIRKMSDEQVAEELERVYQLFSHRHDNLEDRLDQNYTRVSEVLPQSLEKQRRLLLGSYFTHEYSVQAAALFNPSIVPHPDRKGVDDKDIRFVLSLRSTGEGHISSISFCEGISKSSGEIELDEMSNKMSSGKIGFAEDYYSVQFDEDLPLSGRVLFPQTREERMGMEDVRFVYMEDEKKYIGTYTAYDGFKIKPEIIVTKDFKDFRIGGLKGSAVTNKGLALFPKKIDGKYAMIGRQGGRNLSIMFSDDLYHWDDSELLQEPQRTWELLQIGNNGSPIETEAGWLLLTHGVGPMRRYTLSMSLLDLENPAKLIASLEQPLMSPNEEEREGYVPNVLYTCGMMKQGQELIIPYAMSDSAISFARISIPEVLNHLKKQA
ncbi:glycoside hydrolase family 130 protein [Portibacter marinus]|uniref:glycoside hydrolase family 130 protein n=1 Tax=Portibacter marinus TaxID=2898660 RepID=UPI001F2CB1C4|nr:glycoside hydrolase family 130 protein [Portibacter marinus]